MKKKLFYTLLLCFCLSINAQNTITFDDQAYTNAQDLNNFTLTNNSVDFTFSSNSSSPGFQYKLGSTGFCPNSANYIESTGSSVTKITIARADGNEFDLEGFTFIYDFGCFSLNETAVIEGFKDSTSTGSTNFTTSGTVSVFDISSDTKFADVDVVEITFLDGNADAIGIDDLIWNTATVSCTEPDSPTINNPTTAVCSGDDVILNITGNLNDASEWKVYDDMAATNEVASTTGSSVTIKGVTNTTTYYIRGEGGCATTTSLVSEMVTVTPADDATFSYASSSYTNEDSDPTPTITGLAGGIFNADSTLIIDSNTGEIDLSASVPNATYTVTYTTNGSCPNSSTFDVTINFGTFIWDGSTDNGWTQPTNWNTNVVPHITANVSIPAGSANYPTITSSVTVNTINIASGASLIANASVNAQVTYNRNLPTTNWYLVGAPVSGETQQDVIANHTFAPGTAGNLGVAAFDNNDATNAWVYSNVASTGFIIAGYGVSMKLAAPGDVAITGDLITTDYILPISVGTRNNFNLLSNPYTSYINSATLAGSNSAIDNATFWFWDGTEYVTRNNADPIDIAPAQGFFVEANANANIIYSSANQSHQLSDTFMRQQPHNNFQLQITCGEKLSSTKVFYVDGKTTGFDSGYDSKMFGGITSEFAVFTELLTDNNGKKLAIQTLPLDNTLAIPVGLIAKAGEEITFSIENLNLPEGIEVYIEDTTNNQFVSLSEENYTTTLTKDANGVGQFYITTSAKSLSTIEEELTTVSVYKSSNRTLTVTGLNNKANLSVFSLLGKEVVKTSLEANGVNTVNLPTLSAGVYIVSLSTNSGNSISKKITLN